MYKFTLTDYEENKPLKINQHLFSCGLNNEIPYTLTICIAQVHSKYEVAVEFKYNNSKRKAYIKYSYAFDWAYLKELFRFAFKPTLDDKEPQEIKNFLNDKTTRINLYNGLLTTVIRTLGV